MTEFIVEGKGRFPYDMLRYDSCWPRDTSDTHLFDVTRLRRVALRAANPHAPTIARWESFNWKVVEITDSIGLASFLREAEKHR